MILSTTSVCTNIDSVQFFLSEMLQWKSMTFSMQTYNSTSNNSIFSVMRELSYYQKLEPFGIFNIFLNSVKD